MGGKNVKNTITERVLQLVAPHPCFGCGKVGSLVCLHCKYDIVSEPFLGCILCGKPCLEGVCTEHNTAMEKVFVVGMRHGVVSALINGLKFRYMKAAAKNAAQLLDEYLPIFPASTIIVPIPTVRSHVRQRGFDHTDLIAKQFASLRGMEVAPLLYRAGTATQHKLNKRERGVEAGKAFLLSDKYFIETAAPKLLIDDIITTGSTVSEAARLLAQNGSTVFVGALAYQPLD